MNATYYLTILVSIVAIATPIITYIVFFVRGKTVTDKDIESLRKAVDAMENDVDYIEEGLNEKVSLGHCNSTVGRLEKTLAELTKMTSSVNETVISMKTRMDIYFEGKA